MLVFGAVWGVFTIHQPWSYKVQAFVSDALSNDMDFTAVRVWYEENFNGAPAFIPIFGDKDEPAQKAAAHHELSAPVAGSIVEPFASTLKGVEIMPSTRFNLKCDGEEYRHGTRSFHIQRIGRRNSNCGPAFWRNYSRIRTFKRHQAGDR